VRVTNKAHTSVHAGVGYNFGGGLDVAAAAAAAGRGFEHRSQRNRRVFLSEAKLERATTINHNLFSHLKYIGNFPFPLLKSPSTFCWFKPINPLSLRGG